MGLAESRVDSISLKTITNFFVYALFQKFSMIIPIKDLLNSHAAGSFQTFDQIKPLADTRPMELLRPFLVAPANLCIKVRRI